MKRLLAVFLCVTLLFSLAACGEKPAEPEPAPVTEPEPAVEPAPIAEPVPVVEPEPVVEPAPEDDGVIRILGVGNSWMRDSLRWLAAIAHDAGKEVVIGHAYLGGSSLASQYFGLHNSSCTFSHDGVNQIVHGTYQYWKYTTGSDAVKTPSSGYNNGLSQKGVTLESAVSDEPWDYIVFLAPYSSAGAMEGWVDPSKTVTCDGTWPGDTVGATVSWDIAAFLEDLISLLPEGTPEPVIGMEIPWSPAFGNTSSVSQTVADYYNNGNQPRNQQERDAMYAVAHQKMQETAVEVRDYLGDRCDFIVNTGLALWNAREQESLLGLGYKLQRSKSNTHLADGMPMFLASMTLADAILGIRPEDVTWFPNVTAENVYANESNTGISAAQGKITPTAELAETLKQIAVEANRQPLG